MNPGSHFLDESKLRYYLTSYITHKMSLHHWQLTCSKHFNPLFYISYSLLCKEWHTLDANI